MISNYRSESKTIFFRTSTVGLYIITADELFDICCKSGRNVEQLNENLLFQEYHHNNFKDFIYLFLGHNLLKRYECIPKFEKRYLPN